MAAPVKTCLCMSLFAMVSLAFPLAAQYPASADASGAARTASEVRTWRQANETRVMDELRALLAIPNFASDTPNIQRNAAKLVEMLQARGFATQLLPIEGRGPVVFGKLPCPAHRTRLFFTCTMTGNPWILPRGWGQSPTSLHCGTDRLNPAARSFLFQQEASSIRMTGACMRARPPTIKRRSSSCWLRLTRFALEKSRSL